jgi:hypothetical protein
VSNKERIREAIQGDVRRTDTQIAKALGVHRKTVWSVRQELNLDRATKVELTKGSLKDRFHVRVNGNLWRWNLPFDEAEAEAEFLRWPKEPAA